MLGSLMTSRRFAPLFWTQFFSAFNDNFLKNALVFLILFSIEGPHSEALVTLAGAIFIAPFFILSGLGGELADRFDKALVARRLKLAEIGAAAVAVTGFLLHSVPILFVALALFGVIAALFGPIKYGILPDHLETREVPAGNALVEGATFLAILLGTIAGGIASAGGASPLAFAALVIGFAALCWGSSLMIPRTGEGAPDLPVDRNIARSTARLISDIRQDPRLWRGALVVSWFWLVGAVMLSLLPTLVKNALGGSETVVTALLAIFSIGIALGSGLASWLSSGRIVLLPTPIGALLMGVFGLDLAWTGAHAAMPAAPLGAAAFLQTGTGIRVAIDLAALAVAGGLYIVPSFAAVQVWTAKEKRARVIAAVNVLSAAFMVVGAVVVAGLQRAGISTPALIGILSAANLVATAVVYAVLPTNVLRDALWMLFRLVYRVELTGLENVEKAGPNAIIALNHVSFVDAALSLSLLDREPVFAIDHGFSQKWWMKPFMRATRAMPLDPSKPMATRSLINAVKSGETLIIFPEGRLTVTGSLMKVYDGAGLIADKSGAMVVPVKIDGLEQTPFSRLSKSQVRRRWFPKVRVTMMEPVHLAIAPELRGRNRRIAAGAALYGVMSDLVFRTTNIDRSLIEAVIEAGTREGMGRIALEDPLAGKLSYRKLLVGIRVLGGKLAEFAPEGGAIGVMLPSSNGGAVTVFAVMSAGRVPAMINFTAGAANILSACRAAKVDTILTSNSFVEKGKLDKLVAELSGQVRVVALEDVRAEIGFADKLTGFLRCRSPIVRRGPDDPAAILFTSGSEGAPKGVVLSNRNMLANVAQASARIDFGRTDKLFNVLPIFHSFGLTVGLVLPVVSGLPVYLYPSPLHYRLIPELVYGANATVLAGTDTFLAGYARSANPYDLRSIRFVLAGAEPVKESTRRTYSEKFGLRILEGYGVTETSPALALNTPMFNRFGTVGRILPGMDWRLEPVPGIDEGGRLVVRGPNVMLGYVKADRPGELQPPEDGWYDTGDIVTVDPLGFVTIKGRAKRFAKIGGEMISLAAVEALAADLWPNALSAVASAPDARKGERLVMLTAQKDATRQAFGAYAKQKGASDLMIPAEIAVVESIPVLGSGKIDAVEVAKIVADRAKGSERPAPAAEEPEREPEAA